MIDLIYTCPPSGKKLESEKDTNKRLRLVTGDHYYVQKLCKKKHKYNIRSRLETIESSNSPDQVILQSLFSFFFLFLVLYKSVPILIWLNSNVLLCLNFPLFVKLMFFFSFKTVCLYLSNWALPKCMHHCNLALVEKWNKNILIKLRKRQIFNGLSFDYF